MLNVFNLILLVCFQEIQSINILYVSFMPAPSHHKWHQVLAHGLVKKGYNLTYVSPIDNGLKNYNNYTRILADGLFDIVPNDTDKNYNLGRTYSTKAIIEELMLFTIYTCETVENSKGIKQLLSYPKDFHFDLIILEVTVHLCVYPFISRFNYPPVVGVMPFIVPPYVAQNFGTFLYSSHVPWYALPHGTKMTFIERIRNIIFSYMELYYRYNQQIRGEHEISKRIFGEDIPPVDVLESNVSLVLTNVDPDLTFPQTLTPNIISVGGLHTESSRLPQEFKTILDNAVDGVIIFSLGTNVRSDRLEKSTQKAMLDAFSKLPETVIWKFESEMNNLPPNVITKTWLPQNNILGHPNVKLFIGHGGGLSTHEALFHGVPLICIPFMLDQLSTGKIIAERKLGLYLDVEDITSSSFLRDLEEVLRNSIYTTNAKAVSKQFKDRPDTPLERAIFWVEYVLRHKGAPFLNSEVKNLHFIQFAELDVLMLLVATVITTIVVFSMLLKCILKKIIKKLNIK